MIIKVQTNHKFSEGVVDSQELGLGTQGCRSVAELRGSTLLGKIVGSESQGDSEALKVVSQKQKVLNLDHGAMSNN